MKVIADYYSLMLRGISHALSSQARRRAGARSRRIWLGILGGVLIVAMVAALSIGPVSTAPAEVLGAVGRWLSGAESSPADALITAIRLPRVLLAALVGGALAVAGAAMQAVFRNPLAEPGITGVGAGAAVVAVAAIVSGISTQFPLAVPIGAFFGALLATVLVQAAGSRTRGTGAGTLLLIGIALNAFLGAIIAALVANAPDGENARSAMFWLNGDLAGRSMADVALVLTPIILGVAGVMYFSRELNVLSLGEATAYSSGVAVKRVSHTVLLCGALATAGAVATTGVISFVGLVVPHLVRLLAGPNHTFLLPASAVVGASFLVIADTVARMIFSPVVLQTGVVTALVGAPFLLFLVLRTQKVGA